MTSARDMDGGGVWVYASAAVRGFKEYVVMEHESPGTKRCYHYLIPEYLVESALAKGASLSTKCGMEG